MNWVPHIDAICSHVVSQWTYRWHALPRQGTLSSARDAWSLKTLTQYLQDRFDSRLPSLPWMRTVRDKHLSLTAIASLAYEQVAKVRDHGAALIDYYHPLYPELLRNIPDPPNLFTGLGSLELLQGHGVAVVGSRRASSWALGESRKLAHALALRKQVVISGGALGCDIAAHAGALAAGGRPAQTIVVFAGGLAKFYPAYNQRDFDELREAGALFISERLWDYPARPCDFPVRNRIISGLASRLLVMQAGERSGAKISALSAIDQGREVYVLVHPREDIRAQGSQQLIEEGAIPFESSADFLSLGYVDRNW